MKKALFFSLLVLGLTFFAVYFKFKQLYSQPIAQEAKSYQLEVKSGDTINVIIEQLSQQGLIDHPQSVRWIAKYFKVGAKIKTGDYLVHSQLTVEDLFNLISSGKSKGRYLTIPEGYNIFEIAQIFEKENLMTAKEFLTYVTEAHTINRLLPHYAASLEGYLFPETYQITKHTKGPQLIDKMVLTFFARFESLKQKSQQKGWSLHQLTTLASIIEKETGAAWERPIISKVFHNRLDKKMRLQTDPTILYAKALLSGQYLIRITRQDLQLEHPYNTYYINGLPPGPIANPGFDSLKAALEPDPQSKALFFVSRNDGTHIFSEQLKDHNAAVQIFQKDPKAREGKSWRDLQNKKGSD